MITIHIFDVSKHVADDKNPIKEWIGPPCSVFYNRHGDGLVRGAVTAPGILDVAPMFGIGDVTPQTGGNAALFAAVDPEAELAALSDNRRGRLISKSRDWFSEHDISSSWFVSDATLMEALEEASTAASAKKIVAGHLHESRDRWAKLFARSALTLGEIGGELRDLPLKRFQAWTEGFAQAVDGIKGVWPKRALTSDDKQVLSMIRSSASNGLTPILKPLLSALHDLCHRVLFELIRKSNSLVHIRLSLIPKLPSKASTNLGAPHDPNKDKLPFQYSVIELKCANPIVLTVQSDPSRSAGSAHCRH
jgi:hypothetical protein